jgi:hypothetical protein
VLSTAKAWTSDEKKLMGVFPVILAGWMNRHQQGAIEYLKEENKILREKLGKKMIVLDDKPRMRLARLGRAWAERSWPTPTALSRQTNPRMASASRGPQM